jgi:hypothetical protein
LPWRFQEKLNTLVGDVSADGYKFQRDTIQILSAKINLDISFGISKGWKRYLIPVTSTMVHFGNQATSRQAMNHKSI